MRGDESIYDTELHSSLIYNQLCIGGHHLGLGEHLHTHANMHIKMKEQKGAHGKGW